jgi:CDGSH-type Zn-finger protein
MGQPRIKALKDGPYEVTGAVAVQDHQGATYPAGEERVYLCRCGQSANKPFCDGSHKKVGFQAAEHVRLGGGR